MSDFEYQIPDTYEEAVARKAYVLKLINEYNEALLLDKELPCTEEEIDRLQEEYQILNDHLELTEEERISKLKDSDKIVNEDGTVVEKTSFLDNIHWGVMLYIIFTLVCLFGMPFLVKPIGGAVVDNMISKFLYDCLWEKAVGMYDLAKSEFMWTDFQYWSRVALAYLWLPLLLIVISVAIYFVYRRKNDLNTKITKYLIFVNIFIVVLSIGIVLLKGEIKDLAARYEDLWMEYAVYYYSELGSQ